MEINISGLSEILLELKYMPVKLQRAARNAVNTAATRVRNLGINTAAEVFNIDKKSRMRVDSRGRETSYIQRARQGESVAVVMFKGGDNPKAGDRIGLQHFATDKQERNIKQKGWTPGYKIHSSGPVSHVERGFYGVGKLKGQGIFQRVEGMRKIIRQTGPSTKQMVEDKQVMVVVLSQGASILHDEMIQKVEDQLKK